MLNEPFGKDSLDRCFMSEVSLRHVLLPVFKSGFIHKDDRRWMLLKEACPPARTLFDLWDEHGDVDFNDLRGCPPDAEDETTLNRHRVRMATAALLCCDGSMATLVRLLGGPHVAAHRNTRAILRRWEPVLRNHTCSDLARICTFGAPNKVNAASTEKNLMAHLKCGNHSTALEAEDKTKKSLIKDNKRGYSAIFDSRVFWLAVHLHLTPMGMIDLNHPCKNPRGTFDGSFRPEVWCFALNDWLNKGNEPAVHFADSFVLNLVWICNLRITHPRREMCLGEDDQAGAFRHCKHAPLVVGMHCALLFGCLVAWSGQTFGSGASPGNCEPVANSCQQVAQHIWSVPDLVDVAAPFLPAITLEPEPSPEVAATFAQAQADRCTPGVLE